MQYFCVYNVERSINIFETKNAFITYYSDITKEVDVNRLECLIADDYENCNYKDITLISYKPISKNKVALYLTNEEYLFIYENLKSLFSISERLVNNKSSLIMNLSDAKKEIEKNNSILNKIQDAIK